MSDPDQDEDSDNTKAVKICFPPNITCLTFVVHGWPRQEWEVTMAALANKNFDPSGLMEHLVETVATRHPNATVEFNNVAFLKSNVRGALKRLPPPSRREEMQAYRARREEGEAYSMLAFSIATTMRDRGNRSPHFVTQMNDILDAATQLGIGRHHGSNEDVVTYLIAQYDEVGRAGLQEMAARN
jgi:hypothetical protein